MAFDTQAYMTQLAQAAGLSEEDKAVLLKAAQNDKFSKALGDDVLRQQDYSRRQDELAADKQKTAKYYQDLVQWNADQQKAYDEALAKANGQQTIQQVQPDLTKFTQEWEGKLKQRDDQFLGLLEVGMTLASRHAVEFKEPLDTAALKKIAVDNGLSLAAAYDKMVEPRRQETSEASFKAKLQAKYDEGARDALSKHHLPTEAKPREYHPIFDRDPKKQVGADDYKPGSAQLSPVAEKNLRNNFVEAWDTASSVTSGT